MYQFDFPGFGRGDWIGRDARCLLDGWGHRRASVSGLAVEALEDSKVRLCYQCRYRQGSF